MAATAEMPPAGIPWMGLRAERQRRERLGSLGWWLPKERVEEPWRRTSSATLPGVFGNNHVALPALDTTFSLSPFLFPHSLCSHFFLTFLCTCSRAPGRHPLTTFRPPFTQTLHGITSLSLSTFPPSLLSCHLLPNKEHATHLVSQETNYRTNISCTSRVAPATRPRHASPLDGCGNLSSCPYTARHSGGWSYGALCSGMRLQGQNAATLSR